MALITLAYICKTARALVLTLLFLCAGNVALCQQNNFVKRTINWSYKIIQGDSAHPRKNYYLPVPIIAYRPETRWVLGLSLTYLFRLRNNDSITRPTTIRLNTSYSQNHQFSIRQMFDFFSVRNRINVKGLYQYTNFGENFYGIGINSQEEKKEFYEFSMNRYNIKAAWQVLPKVYAGSQVIVEHMYRVSHVANSMFDRGNVPGANGSLSSGAGFTVYYDDRNNIYFPTKGQFIEVSNCFYNHIFGSQFDFVNVSVDGRKYVRLRKEDVLAFQLIANLNSGNIPFRLMGTLGSDMYMRGYYNGRYRDRNSMAFQAELRKHVWGPLGVVAFGGFGTVSPYPEQLVTHLKANYGAGLRIMAIPREKMNIRIDYGAGVDGANAFYLTMSEAF